MSEKSAKDFLKRMSTDDAFRAKIEKAQTDADRKKIVKGEGYDFTKEELKSAGKSAELSEKELETVAGGSSAAWVAVAIGGVGAAAAAA
jgi:predicted ribosomally synthesized peptide with nif11-like leader